MEPTPVLRSRSAAALAGMLAAAVALGVGELVAAIQRNLRSPVVSVGDEVIDRVPRPVKDLAIDWFGTNDKIALVAGIVVLALGLGALLGLLARRRFVYGVAGLVGFAAVGVLTAHRTPGAPWFAALPSLAAGAAGIATLWWFLRPTSLTSGSSVEPDRSATAAVGGSGGGRRQFLIGSAAVAGIAVASATSGRWLQRRFNVAAARLGITLPAAATAAAAIPAGVDQGVAGQPSWYTANSDFYRIDINLSVPQIDPETWNLRVHGMVDQEINLSYADLLERPLTERDITLTCVSNEVGGSLVGNARWLGYPLEDLLAEAGIDARADQIVGRSVDDYTCGFPVSALDGRGALVAVAMNGEPLPTRSGFPARLIVAGLYGYVSATKWLTEIELTRFDEFDQYWVRQGRDWDAEAPIKLMSRIDTPRPLARAASGAVVVAGVAWAQTVGIDAVELSVDGGEWVPTVLAPEANAETWRQWRFDWDAAPGRHSLAVRATDRMGMVQTDERATPFPNGASGLHEIVVIVDG